MTNGFCPYCGAQHPGDFTFCPTTGKALRQTGPPTPPAPPSAAQHLEESTPLSRIVRHLTENGFELRHDISYRGQAFSVVAHAAKTEISKFGFAEYFYVVGSVPESSVAYIRRFSSEAYNYCAKNRKSAVLPGLMSSFFVFPVVLVPALSDIVTRDIEKSSPPKHFGSGEFPIVVDQATNAACFYRGTPLWGAAYYAGFRQLAGQIASAVQAR